MTEEGAAVASSIQQLVEFKREIEETFQSRVEQFLVTIEDDIKMAMDQLPVAFAVLLEPLGK